MHVYDHFRYNGANQRWTVPEGVTEALFECWGAAGGLPSDLAFEGKKRQVVGGTGPANNVFYNSPYGLAHLGTSFANCAGYASGIKSVVAGEVYYVRVGGNGAPGHSTIKLKDDGSYEVSFHGGDGGFNGGGNGGQGAHVHQNLYDSTSTKVHYTHASMPNSAKSGQLWHDTTNNLVKKCNHTYTAGTGQASYWDKVTDTHDHAAGPSGGGGGGATDIRYGGNDVSNRILVAGGGGGAGGHWNKTGVAAWALHSIPANPSPPFGTDDKGTGATGPDNTWATKTNYLSGGWGGGGMGGATGPAPNTSPTVSGGRSTAGGAGGPATARHKDGVAPSAAHGSGGSGGGSEAGGGSGSGGSGAQAGSLGSGGNGADAAGGNDDWCAGGGGGGGGWYGGGGGGQGFKVSGHNSSIGTRGGGGGGGSNYADPVFSAFFLGGAAQPPYPKGNSGTGANGHGGFARVSYRLDPVVRWKIAPSAVLAASSFDVTFDYSPALDSGPTIAYYTVGTSATPTDTFPTAVTTIMVTDGSTEFTHTFTAPAAGVQEAYFVQVTDTDGDSSAWLKQKVTGLTSAQTTSATITTPATGAQFVSPETVDWTLGTQTPLAAYRLGLSGDNLSGGGTGGSETGWRRGGSRVNLARDPGFLATTEWGAAVASATSHPGVSGHNGQITWATTDDFSGAVTSLTYDNLMPGTTYRLHLEVASNLADDPRPVEVQVWDANGMLTSADVDLSATAAGTYVPLDLEFTPQTQAVYFAVVPSGSGLGAQMSSDDFEGSTDSWAAVGGYTVTSDATQSYQGDDALKVIGSATGSGATKTITSLLTAGAGWYVVQGYGYSAAGTPTLAAGGASGTCAAGAFNLIRFPFLWDGSSAVTLSANGDTAGIWYDLVEVYAMDQTSEPTFGDTDSGQVTYLANMLLELKYEEDAGGYGAYFDGSHLNGLTGTVSWEGTTNASPSFLTGTNILTGSLTYDGAPLNNGLLYLDTLTEQALVTGQDGVRASHGVNVNPSLPTTPTVTLNLDSTAGLITLTINAADGAATYKTTSFDILRDGVRIATGLIPDGTTRQAVYTDFPASGSLATYTVRAWDSQGGFADQTTGTVTGA